MTHPSAFIPSELTHTVRALSAQAEALGQLHPEQLAIVYEQGWFNLFVPKEYGGLERSLVEGLQIEEALAWIDGSTGWTVTLCSGANMFIGFLPLQAVTEIFKDPKVCLAGSGRASGIATVTQDGYQITGYWKYATGAPHATFFTANCAIEKDAILLKDEGGNPLVRSFWFKREEVVLHKDWNCMGLMATASHSFEVEGLPVPDSRSFIIDSNHAFLQHPIYHFPFLQFAEATLAVNSSGMAIRFLDLYENLLIEKEKKEYSPAQSVYVARKKEKAEQKLDEVRTVFYTAVEKAWNQLLNHHVVTPETVAEVSRLSRHLAATARQVVDELYPYCGLIAAHPHTEINRVWRNLHTASQHSLLTFPDVP